MDSIPLEDFHCRMEFGAGKADRFFFPSVADVMFTSAILHR